jgi:hypothetical protein
MGNSLGSAPTRRLWECLAGLIQEPAGGALSGWTHMGACGGSRTACAGPVSPPPAGGATGHQGLAARASAQVSKPPHRWDHQAQAPVGKSRPFLSALGERETPKFSVSNAHNTPTIEPFAPKTGSKWSGGWGSFPTTTLLSGGGGLYPGPWQESGERSPFLPQYHPKLWAYSGWEQGPLCSVSGFSRKNKS